jgi:hypothetical protein
MRPEAGPDALFPRGHSFLEPPCFVNASYTGILPLGDPRSITGIIIMLGGTAIFAKTRIQRTTSRSSTEAEIIAGCDAGKVIKYFRQVFFDLRLLLTGPLPLVKITRALSLLPLIAVPVAALGTWTYRTLPLKSGLIVVS